MMIDLHADRPRMSTPQIHPSAIVHEKATVSDGCEIGPFCVVGENVTIGANCKLHSHVVLDGHTELGDENEVYPFAAIGLKTQDLKWKGGTTWTRIGHRNTFRENVTVHSATDGPPEAPRLQVLVRNSRDLVWRPSGT